MRPPKVSSFLCRLRFVDHKQNQKIIVLFHQRTDFSCQRLDLSVGMPLQIPDLLHQAFPCLDQFAVQLFLFHCRSGISALFLFFLFVYRIRQPDPLTCRQVIA